MRETKINEFLTSQNNQTINFNKDIIVSDLDGNSRVIIKCYCTIISGKSISHYMTVEDEGIFENNKEAIQTEINKFKEEAIKLAQNNNVPII
ncbi:hypothetical protein H9L25_00235 [Terrisporobacter mayombei]|nr:hypothetical protein [Terrisporobacter mayombei]